MTLYGGLTRYGIPLLILGVPLLWAGACGSNAPDSVPSSTIDPAPQAANVITIGDIDPEEPLKKIERFQPLANYLADRLKRYGIEAGRVVIARDIEEMGGFIKDGTVDVFFDSPFPALSVQELSGAEMVLRRWKEEVEEYWSIYVALADSGISKPEDFRGTVIAFEEPHSTSGFILPAGTLVKRGLVLTEVADPDAAVPADEIGYFFSMDEEDTIELILRGQVSGGGISNGDYDELPPDLKERIVAFGRTVAVPRQVVSVRPGLDPELMGDIRRLLVELDQSEEGRALLDGLKKTKKFDPLPPSSEASLLELREMIELVRGED